MDDDPDLEPLLILRRARLMRAVWSSAPPAEPDGAAGLREAQGIAAIREGIADARAAGRGRLRASRG